jgi:ribosomal protein L12E/L44/L45/RPP1/RPP2
LLEGRDVGSMLVTAGGSSGPAPAGGAAPAAAGGAAPAKEAEKPKEKSEESEADLGFSLFD